jgi:hypothetical protein
MPRIINLASLSQFTAINLTSDPGYDPDNPVIPSCAQITLVWGSGSGIVAHNVIHGRYSGPFAGTQAQADAIHTALGTGAQWTALATHLATATVFAAVYIRDLGVLDAPIITSLTPGKNGTSSGTELPNEVAAVITKRTAFTGPANRGRIYVPGFATTALGPNNTIATAAVTALGNWGSIIAGALSAQGYVFSIGHHSRKAYTGISGKNHPARPAGTVPITNVAVRDNHWDSQRRRGLV